MTTSQFIIGLAFLFLYVEKKRITSAEALQKIYHYCAYQERTHHEVRGKLYEMGLYKEEIDEIVSHLITNNFLNESRFAKAFAGGKFRMKSWGRLKIIHELEARGLTKRCIQDGLKEIDDGEYERTLRKLISKKAEHLKEENVFKLRDKVAQYVIGKGYEPDLVWRMLKNGDDQESLA